MLLRWNMLFFDFCMRCLRLFDYFSAGNLVLPKQCCRKTPSWYRRNSAARNAPSWYCRNGAAKLAASWARLTKLAASMAIYTKLAVSMAVQAILGAFPAALVRHDYARKTFSLYFVVTLLWLLKLRINTVCKSARSRFASRLYPVKREQHAKHKNYLLCK